MEAAPHQLTNVFLDAGEVRRTLLGAVTAAAGSFEPDELAYLAVTGKIELPFRDRLAWRLQRQPEHQDLVIAREWRRADLALLLGAELCALIEAKALYTFDVHSAANLKKYLGYVRADLAKANALADRTPAFALVLLTHVTGVIPVHLRAHVVKYSHGVAKLQGRTEAREAAVAILTRELSKVGGAAGTEHRSFDAGRVFGLDVGLDAWVVGPVFAASGSGGTRPERPSNSERHP